MLGPSVSFEVGSSRERGVLAAGLFASEPGRYLSPGGRHCGVGVLSTAF